MRKTNTIFSLIITLVIICVATNAEAQRRAHQNGRHKNQNHSENRGREYSDIDGNGRHDYKNRKEYHHNHNYDHRRRHVRHVHHNKPRYIYYRDYDVYYDCHRSVYISYSGRNWTISTARPHAMRHINIQTTRSYEVEYYNDDFPSYLERRRPAYGREYAGW